MSSGRRKLSVLQRRFAMLYDGNGAETARRAKYNCSSNQSFAQIAYILLQHPDILDIIKDRESAELDPLVADLEERMEFWTAMMRNTEEHSGMRLQASKLLGSACGDFIFKQEIDTKGSPAVLMVPFISEEEWRKKFLA
jgi:phage terminase small subunit